MKRIARALGAAGISAAIVAAVWAIGSMACFPLTMVDLDAGAEVFESRCASCHATGSADVDSYGPNLASIGLQAAHRVPAMSAEEYLLESILKPEAKRVAGERGIMPTDISAGLRPDEIVSIVGFLMTRGSAPDPRKLLGLLDKARAAPAAATEEIVFADVEAGKEIFLGKGNCGRCHVLRDLPGHDLRAPSLLAVGNHDTKYLRESITDPNRNVTAGYQICTLRLKSGKSLSGRLLRRDESGILLLAESEGEAELSFVPWLDVDVDDAEQPILAVTEQSAMPSGLQRALSEREIDQLVAFLKTLK